MSDNGDRMKTKLNADTNNKNSGNTENIVILVFDVTRWFTTIMPFTSLNNEQKE